MGEQIARNNAALPTDRAVSRIAGHLRAYWTPAMIEQLAAFSIEHPEELEPTLAAALRAAVAPGG